MKNVNSGKNVNRRFKYISSNKIEILVTTKNKTFTNGIPKKSGFENCKFVINESSNFEVENLTFKNCSFVLNAPLNLAGNNPFFQYCNFVSDGKDGSLVNVSRERKNHSNVI